MICRRFRFARLPRPVYLKGAGTQSMAMILDGKKRAQEMQGEIAAQVAAFAGRTGIRPGLAAVLVGENSASQVYVRNKRKACEAAGMNSWLHQLSADTSQSQ